MIILIMNDGDSDGASSRNYDNHDGGDDKDDDFDGDDSDIWC